MVYQSAMMVLVLTFKFLSLEFLVQHFYCITHVDVSEGVDVPLIKNQRYVPPFTNNVPVKTPDLNHLFFAAFGWVFIATAASIGYTFALALA